MSDECKLVRIRSDLNTSPRHADPPEITDLWRYRQSLEAAYRVDSQGRQLNERRMQTCEDTFGLALGFGIGRGLMKFVRLFERIESLQQDFVDFRGRHAGFALILSDLLAIALPNVFRCFLVQGHKIL